MAEKVTKISSTVQYLEESNLKLKRIIEDSREENNRKQLRVGTTIMCKEFIKWSFKDHFQIESEDYKVHIFHSNVKHDSLSRHTLKTFCVTDASFIDAMNFCNQAYIASNITILSYNSSNEMFGKFRR